MIKILPYKFHEKSEYVDFSALLLSHLVSDHYKILNLAGIIRILFFKTICITIWHFLHKAPIQIFRKIAIFGIKANISQLSGEHYKIYSIRNQHYSWVVPMTRTCQKAIKMRTDNDAQKCNRRNQPLFGRRHIHITMSIRKHKSNANIFDRCSHQCNSRCNRNEHIETSISWFSVDKLIIYQIFYHINKKKIVSLYQQFE